MNNTATPANAETVGILDRFQTELVAAWGRLPNKFFFLVLLAGWLTLFQFFGNSTFGYFHTPSLLKWAYGVWADPNPETAEPQGLWIPFVVLGLFWWKRNELLALPLRIWWPGLFMVALALGLHLVAYVIQQPRISIVALFAGLYGLMGLVWGRKLIRASLFPFFLFVFCIPLGTLADFITVPLQILVCRIVEFVSHHLLGIGVVRAGTQLFDSMGRYQYEVAAACSGIRSLISIGTISVIGAFVFFRAWWRRGLLIASAVPLAILGNALRLLTIIITAEVGGQSAGNYVHEGGPAGLISLIPYVPAFLGLIVLRNVLEEPKDSKPKPV
jgi:exosortase